MLVVLLGVSSCTNNDDEKVETKELDANYTFIADPTSRETISFINTSVASDNYIWNFGDGTSSTIKDPVKTYTATGDYTVTLTAKNTSTGKTDTFSSVVSVFVFDGGLAKNGNFESGVSSWTSGVATPIATDLLITSSGNTYYSRDVTAVGNAYDVNLSQKGLNMTEGKTYRLTFDAWSNVNRPIIVGIGLSSDPWTNQTVTQNITTTSQTFTLDLVANFSNIDSRIIFDLGAALGRVNIDNVTLKQLP